MTEAAMWILALLECVESMEISTLQEMLAYSGKWKESTLEWLRKGKYIVDLPDSRIKITNLGHKDFIREVLKNA